MRGPAYVFWANLTPFSLQLSVVDPLEYYKYYKVDLDSGTRIKRAAEVDELSGRLGEAARGRWRHSNLNSLAPFSFMKNRL
jgi:hypothetical protein